jgi:hypothetical protein
MSLTDTQINHVNAIIGAIKAEQKATFDMEVLIAADHCGTAACIAGFSHLLTSEITNYSTVDMNVEGEKFGLCVREAMDLFTDQQDGVGALSDITKDMAIAALTDIIKTGTFPGWKDYAFLNPNLWIDEDGHIS